MAKKVDIIDVMVAVYKGDLKIVIQNGFFLLEHTKSGERVRLNETQAVEVVHCQDCKQWCRNIGIVDSPNGHCFCHDIETNGHDFCSYGERRSDVQTTH